MKFLETLNGSFVNVNEISAIYHENTEYNGKDIYHSFLNLRNGETYEFLEVPNELILKNSKSIPFDCDYLLSWHRYVCEQISLAPDGVIMLDALEEAWSKTANDLRAIGVDI